MAHTHTTDRVSLERARSTVLSRAQVTGVELVPVESALGRVAAEPARARLASPHYRAAAMDGIAVRSRDSAGAASAALLLSVIAVDGEVSAERAGCCPVDTGSPMPSWADAVVRIEDTSRTEGGFEIRSPVPPGRDVRAIGEDVAAGAVLLGRGHTVTAPDIGALIATGVSTIAVRRRPRIGVITTGGEIIEPLAAGALAAPGQVIEFNSRVLAAYAHQWGATSDYLGCAGDDPERLASLMSDAVAEHDAACLIAGSSAGRKDLSVAAVARAGAVFFHGVEVMPGKPAAFGVVREKPVFVVPGYPVSAIVVYRELLRAWIDAALGRAPGAARTVAAVVRRKIASRLGVEELLRVCLAADGDELVVAPLPRGAGSITSVVRAHGLLRIGSQTEGYAAGARVEVELLDGGRDPRAAVVVAGPPESISAELEDALARSGPPLRFSHLGLAPHDARAALAAGEAHLAVFDIEAGDPERGSDTPRMLTCEIGGRSGVAGRRLVATAALLATPAGARVRAMLGAESFAEALSSGLGHSVSVTIRA